MIFASLTREGIGYSIEREETYAGNDLYRSHASYLSSHFTEYETYGDELIQHSHASVVRTENFVDCLASLASHLFSNPSDVEKVARFWPHAEHRKEIQFAMSLKYNEDKPTHYSLDEWKTSRSSSKAYDKRWELVPSWADGTLKAVFNLLMEKRSFYNAIERYNLYQQTQEAFREIYWYQHLEGNGIGLEEDQGDVDYAYRSVDLLVQASRSQEHAKRVFECLENNWISKQKKEEACSTT